MLAYIDDSWVGSPDRQTHLRHLVAFFNALATNGLAINLEKCVLAAPSLEILGHTISATGAAPTADHAAEIKNCPSPQDIKQLQCFLGMVNFYRRFLPNCAQVLKPLTDLLKGGGGQNFAMDHHRSGGFPAGQTPPSGGCATSTPRPNAELSLATDTSDIHIGGVMQQKSKDHWQPLGFFSRKLTDTESHYSTFDRELLAAQAAIKHFRHFYEGRLFQLWTDHKPLVTVLPFLSRINTNLPQTTAPLGVYFRI